MNESQSRCDRRTCVLCYYLNNGRTTRGCCFVWGFIRDKNINTCRGIRSIKFRMAITSGGGKRDSDWGPDFNSLGSVLFLKLDYEYMGVCSIILYTCLYV